MQCGKRGRWIFKIHYSSDFPKLHHSTWGRTYKIVIGGERRCWGRHGTLLKLLTRVRLVRSGVHRASPETLSAGVTPEHQPVPRFPIHKKMPWVWTDGSRAANKKERSTSMKSYGKRLEIFKTDSQQTTVFWSHQTDGQKERKESIKGLRDSSRSWNPPRVVL